MVRKFFGDVIYSKLSESKGLLNRNIFMKMCRLLLLLLLLQILTGNFFHSTSKSLAEEKIPVQLFSLIHQEHPDDH